MDRDLRRCLLLPGIVLLAGLGLVRAAPAAGVRAASYEIEVRCFPDESRLEGQARIRLAPAGRVAGTVRFWLHGELRATAVRAGRAELEFSQQRDYYEWDYSLIGNRVEVSLPKGAVPELLEVTWGGPLNPSKARSPSDYMRIDADGVFLRALGYSPWFPLFLDEDGDDHAVDFDLVRIEAPQELTAVFAGDHLRSTTDGKLTRSEWRARGLSLFDAQLTVRRFTILREGAIRVYPLRDEASVESAESILGFTRALLAYYTEHYAEDAVVGQLHVVEMPEFGDISSRNVVGIQQSSWRSFERSDGSKRTLAHELVHPFVQPDVARSDPLYALVIEGFPSYFHYPALAAIGALDYDRRISEVRQSYLTKRRTGRDLHGRPLPTEKPITRITADEIGLYKDVFVLADRALLFLDDLRREMGEERFHAFTRELFALESVDDRAFRALVLGHLPDQRARLTLWLDTTELSEPESVGH
ncbi:MAG TPA: hypothetical protein VD788_15555 [Candidatus Polarisedimenticolaceae bacterium]|nr:hypothetical protein [Candidatus Polarisedimenticolaceae bacterium]